MKKIIKEALGKAVVKSAKNACGRASINMFCQPKESAVVRAAFEKK